MNFTKIVFFNQWRNGDCFINKEYVRDIISRFPNVEFLYAHNNHPNIVEDLNCRHVTLNDIPAIGTFVPLAVSQTEPNTLYINTWVGCWIGKHLAEKDHANFHCLHTMWKEIFNALDIEMKGDYFFYLPKIDWYRFDLKECDSYLRLIIPKNLILICNGVQQSEQSSMGDMKNIINSLSSSFPDYAFLITHDIGITKNNVNCTDSIFGSPTGNLNQIGYISQFAKLIVGKNSGPFTYAHTKTNMNNPEQTFMCFSHKMRDCLMGEGDYLTNSYFSDTIDDGVAIRIITDLILKPTYISKRKPTKHIT